MNDNVMEKAEIRNRIRQRKREMTKEEIENKSKAIYKQLQLQEAYLSAHMIYCYMSYNQEVDTRKLIEEALQQGKRVALPKVVKDKMKFYEITSLDDVASGYQGILEPVTNQLADGVPGIMLLPGLAFDRKMNRVGYGGGFYDNYLKQYGTCIDKKIALAYEFQVVSEILTEPFDEKVDMIITTEEIIQQQTLDTKKQIEFLPMKKKGMAASGETLFSVAQKVHVPLSGSCGGNGVCGKCKVKIIQGIPSKPTKEEKEILSEKELEAGVRLACKVIPQSDLCVQIFSHKEESNRKKELFHLPLDFKPQISIQKVFCKKDRNWSKDANSILERIREEAGKENIAVDSRNLADISFILHASSEMTITFDKDRMIAVEAQDTRKQMYGVIFDLGTTTIVAMLWDFRNMALVDSMAMTNAQSQYGADVISRIQYSMKENNAQKMHQLLLNQCNEMILKLSEKHEISKEFIYKVVVAGNTTMNHLFLGVSTATLAKAPSCPVFLEQQKVIAKDIGMDISSYGEITVLSNIGGHVGGDITADMITVDFLKNQELSIMIDIGTNGEIVVVDQGKAIACSTAAGPAFEGGGLKCGMRADIGAIEAVALRENSIQLKVIGEIEPIGICGSGIIDLIAELLEIGLVDSTGRILEKQEAKENKIAPYYIERLEQTSRCMQFVVYEAKENKIVITQEDIRQIQLSKAAIKAGVMAALHYFGKKELEISQLFVAGAFGSYIKTKSAIRMGLLPKIEEVKIKSIGNSAAIGASMALLSEEILLESDALAHKVLQLELSKDTYFQKKYIEEMMF